MCENCWNEAGKPAIENAKTRTAARLINQVYELHGAGGLGHVVFDDWNIDCVESCLGDCDNPEYQNNVEQDVVEISRVALEYFKGLSEEERFSALAMREYFFTTNEPL